MFIIGSLTHGAGIFKLNPEALKWHTCLSFSGGGGRREGCPVSFEIQLRSRLLGLF